ncbi:MAG: hypothetical protein ACKVP7_14150 [Hyphomicrobiaceae bacterium]
MSAYHKIVEGGVAALILAVWTGTVAAQEICVVCTGPEAAYRCRVEDSAGRASSAARLACITTLAREGQHETCGVKSAQTAGPCVGAERRVSLPVTVPDPLPAAPGMARADEVKVAQPPSTDKPPETVEALAKQVTKSSGEQIKKTGDSIGAAAAKTWGCLTSFFKGC